MKSAEGFSRHTLLYCFVLGDVMKESARTAYTQARTMLSLKDPDNGFLEKAQLHIHVPEVCFKCQFVIIFG